jgi:hypothetical protein
MSAVVDLVFFMIKADAHQDAYARFETGFPH